MMRRIAVVGDRLAPQGGQLSDSSSLPVFFHGHQLALIGGKAYCEGCDSVGTICKTGGPRRMWFMGEVALDGDRVLCQCKTRPRIVAQLAGEVWYDDAAEANGPVASKPVVLTNTAETFDELVIAISPTGPVADYPYFVETSEGQSQFGYTDAHGQLPRVATDAPGSITVYWGDEALAKRHGNGDAK